MLQENYRITNEEELQSVVSRIAGSKAYQEMHAVLVQVYTVGTRLEQAASAIKLLRMKLTRAVVIGVSSMGGEGNNVGGNRYGSLMPSSYQIHTYVSTAAISLLQISRSNIFL